MKKQQVAPYGSWKSPITSDMIVSGTTRLEQVVLDSENIYWIEMRPAQGGRCVVVCHSQDGKIEDITPSPFNARTRVHEYGGGAFVIHEGQFTSPISPILAFIARNLDTGHDLSHLPENFDMQMPL